MPSLRDQISRVVYDNLYGLIDGLKRVDLSDGIADAILKLIEPRGENAMQDADSAKRLMENFEDEDWNARRERLEGAVSNAVSDLMTKHMGGASGTEFAPIEGCPYRITIKFEEVKNGSFN